MPPSHNTQFQIDAAPRRRRLLDPPPSGRFRLGGITIRHDTPVTIVTPNGTPEYLDLATVESTLSYALLLATPAPGSEVRFQTRRTVLGDARDFLVHALRTCLGVHDLNHRSDDGGGAALQIHVGPTSKALEILGSTVAQTEDLTGWNNWDGQPRTLDADGYVHLCVVEAVAQFTFTTHLVLLGGTAYGTYFCVADFLHRHLDARWLMPGRLGTVLPPRDTLWIQPGDALNWIEEPDVRSRTLAAMTDSNQMSAAECDDHRTWLLRNRYRPLTDRSQIFYSGMQESLGSRNWATTTFCAPPLDVEVLVMKMLEHEGRLPVFHNMRGHLRPFAPPALPRRHTAPRYVSEVYFYPDIRPRIVPGAQPSIAGFNFRPPRAILDPRLGVQDPHPMFRYQEAPDLYPYCRQYVPFDGMDSMVLKLARSDAPALMAALMSNDQFVGIRSDQEIDGSQSATMTRFIPRSWFHRHEGTYYPFDHWHPCIYDYRPTLPMGQLPPVHSSLGADIAVQVLASLQPRADAFEGVIGYSLAFDDGDVWCHCDSCDRVIAHGGYNGDILFYRGFPIAYPRSAIDRFSGAALRDQMGLELRPEQLLLDLDGSKLAWNRSLAENPFTDCSLDQLAMQGVIGDSGVSNLYSCRVIMLLNAVCASLRSMPMLASFQSSLQIGFLAYTDYSAAPMIRWAHDSSEQLDAMLTPSVTTRRDTNEYETLGEDQWPLYQEPGTISGAFLRMRDFPQQFNHERWAAMARRTGFYEYFDGQQHIVPAIYTRRLSNATYRAFQQMTLRSFISETTPNWGLEGPMYWEIGRVLWDTTPENVSLARHDFCVSAFGAAAEPMQQYIDLCEAAWSSTRDERQVFTTRGRMLRADRRDNSNVASGYYGHGWAGRAAYLSQLEGWYRTPSGAANERLYLARDLLDRALDAALAERRGAMSAAERTAAQQHVDRVQFYRRTFGLMYLIAEWYRPIHLAVERIRANNPSDALTPMQYPAHVDGTFVTFAKAHPDDPFPTDITRGGVTVEHTGVRSAGESGTVAAASDRILTQVLLRLDGTSQQWTVRGLRNQVHRYLATHDLTIANMPTLGSWLGRLSSEADHRLGICEGSLDEATSPANPTDLGAVVPIIPAVERTTVGVNLPSLFRYVNWWMGCVYTTDEAGRRLLQQPRLREDLVAAGENTGSFGWIFSELKYMCGFVLLYGGTGLLPADIARSKQLILRG